MPYVYNEKSGLISVPIKTSDIMSFERDMASSEKVEVNMKFLDRTKVEQEEATNLFVQAFDFNPTLKKDDTSKKIDYEELQEAIPEQLFPPCMKHILQGVDEGRKRSVFILINFLSSVGWIWDQIEETLKEWNKKNKVPLKEVYWKGQLKYAKKNVVAIVYM